MGHGGVQHQGLWCSQLQLAYGAYGERSKALRTGGRFQGMGGAVIRITECESAAAGGPKNKARQDLARLQRESAARGRCSDAAGGLSSPASQTLFASCQDRSQ